jgi:hypothetical protein
MSIQDNLDRFYSKKWGIFNHFLGGNNAEAWNRRVDGVNVDLWAEQLAELGCGFMGITIMQVARTMLAPNETYDRITGYKPGEACAKRDFIMDLSNALRKYDIDLMLYYTGDGPCRDSADIANRAFGFTTPRFDYERGEWIGKREPDFIPESFVDKWTAVLREYAVRYGDRVFAWWVDGCYSHFYPDSETREKYLKKYVDAVRAGNPDALITFNNGYSMTNRDYEVADPYASCRYDNFTPGEEDSLFNPPTSRYINGVQWFGFFCNGFWWEKEHRGFNLQDLSKIPETRFTPDALYDYVKRVHEGGGIVMFDTRFVRDERIDPRMWKAMSKLKHLKD